MEAQSLVLIANDDIDILRQLKTVLDHQKIRSSYAASCEEARQCMLGNRAPDVVFTGTSFPDGTWRDVLAMSRTCKPHPAVILTTRLVDMNLYFDAMEERAFDYVVPPFALDDLAWIIACAAAQGFGRRKQKVASFA